MIEVERGDGPIILGLPHTGTELPPDIAEHLNDDGLAIPDTDWNVDKLYHGLIEGVTTVRTPIHRYAIDVNRDPEGQSLYPGQNTTTLCPVTDFDGNPIYEEGEEPDEDEINRRIVLYHQPYHDALSTEVERIRSFHGAAILYDCHSIRSRIPFLFRGTLPDFNIGTNDGRTCAEEIERSTREICEAAKDYRTITNGRFRGGWTTRHYGRPEKSVHAIQMELAQSTYMEERPPWSYDPERANRLRVQLARILNALSALVTEGRLS